MRWGRHSPVRLARFSNAQTAVSIARVAIVAKRSAVRPLSRECPYPQSLRSDLALCAPLLRQESHDLPLPHLTEVRELGHLILARPRLSAFPVINRLRANAQHLPKTFRG